MGLGAAESLHTAVRGEQITIIVLNNGVLADTGGQLAATTLTGQGHQHDSGRSRARNTVPRCRSSRCCLCSAASPIAERVAIDSALGVRRVRRAIAKAFEVQRSGARIVDRRGAQPVPNPLADGLGAGVGVHHPIGAHGVPDRRAGGSHTHRSHVK